MQMLSLQLKFLKVNELELGKCYGHVHISLGKLRKIGRKSVLYAPKHIPVTERKPPLIT